MSNDRDTVRFVSAPTELVPARRWAADLGLDVDDLWIKRDDLIGLGGGGNKVRKVEYFCGEALAGGATTLVTTGAPQSNHARVTAAAGAALGLEVVLVLEGHEPGTHRGNLLLDDLFGARIVWSGDEAPGVAASAVRAQLQADGVRSLLIPFGGSSPESAMTYAEAARELLGQLPDVQHVVVAVGSGGTMAGLVSELGPNTVLGVSSGAVADPRGTVAGLLARMPGKHSPSADELRLDLSEIGAGYGDVTEGARAALRQVARAEGIVLDPTYTGRAAAGLKGAVLSGQIRPGEHTVFVHTGGLPGFFAGDHR